MSNSEANKVVRVITGRRLKFTVTILRKDGAVVEFQSDRTPDVIFSNEIQQPLVTCIVDPKDSYSTKLPIMPWAEVLAMHAEINPEAEEAKA